MKINSQKNIIMTNSQKILKKIMAYSFGIGVLTGAIALSGEELFPGKTEDIFSSGFGVPAGICAFVFALAFVAFLISLIVTSSKGQ